MLLRVSVLMVLVSLWSLPGEAQEAQDIHEILETPDKAQEPRQEEPQVNKVQDTSHQPNGLHVIVICKENEMEAERSFRQTACQMGYNSFTVVREKCTGGTCEFYNNLESQLRSLPTEDNIIVADIRSRHAYLMASPSEALEQLKPWHDQLILAHPPYIPLNQKEEIMKDSSKNDDESVANREDTDINNSVETNEINKDKKYDKTKDDHLNKIHRDNQFDVELNRLKRALNGGSAIGAVGLLLEALGGNEIPNVFNDTISQHIYFGDYVSGSFAIGVPVRLKVIPHGSQEEDATTPILAYFINDNPDFYNIIQLGSEVQEIQNQCLYEAPLPYSSIYPSLTVLINLPEKWSPFLEEVFQGLLNQNFPKESMDVRIVNIFGVNTKEVSSFIFESTNLYRSVAVIDNKEEDNLDIRNLCASLSCDYVIMMSPRALLETNDVINRLLETKRLLVAPLLKAARNKKDVNYVYNLKEEDGQWDQLIKDRHLRSIVKVAQIKDFVLAHKTVFDGAHTASFLDARRTVGVLVDPRGGHESKLHKNLWGIRFNSKLWIRRYIEKDLIDIIKKKKKPQELGHYMYYVPFFTERFCREMIEEMEHHGEWFDDEKDNREVAHQYTSRNINLVDLGYHDEYMALLNSVHKELLSTLYNGFRSKPEASLIFVLKYSPAKEYGTFKYHLDGATYTYNIALNDNFTGGGLQFKMGNPKFGKEEEFIIPHNRTGWAVIQPNRPLHMHRGVALTTGTRYAMINIIETSCSGCKGGPLW